MKGKTGITSKKLMPEPHGPMHIDSAGEKMIGRKHGGKVEGKKPHGRADKRARGGGIKIKPSHKGLLHKDLGVKSGSKIPEKKLEKAKHSSDAAVRKRATFAENAKSWGKG
jgi:hypothetical protein